MSTQVKQKNVSLAVNFMEELTEEILQDLISEDKGRSLSSSAIQDVKALALNRLWPMYVTSQTGRHFLKKVVVEDRVEDDIVRELKAAMAKVRSHPHA